MQQPQLLIHIGYPKTASKWLQQTIFNNNNAGFTTPWGTQSGEAVEQFVNANTFTFNPESAYKAFEVGLQEAYQHGLIPVLSQEMLSGDQVLGIYCGKQAAERIYEVFPSAKILILIREQKSMILSSYREHIKLGGNLLIEKFIGIDNRKPGFSPICRLDYLEYDLLISYYQRLFGRDNISVIPFELLRKSPQDVVDKILNFTQSPKKLKYEELQLAQNVGFQSGTLVFRRKLNSFLSAPDFSQEKIPLHWGIAQKISKTIDKLLPQAIHEQEEKRLRQIISDYVGNKFCDSNQKTSQLIDINLTEFGYDS